MEIETLKNVALGVTLFTIFVSIPFAFMFTSLIKKGKILTNNDSNVMEEIEQK